MPIIKEQSNYSEEVEEIITAVTLSCASFSRVGWCVSGLVPKLNKLFI
jgi:hypothetical protein